MCPACWAMVAMVTAGVASIGALGILGVRVAQRAGAGKPVSLQNQTNSRERRDYDEHGD